MPTPADERMDGILSLIRASRAEFARIFDAVASVHDPEKVTLRSLVQVARLLGPPGADAGSDRAAFGLALRHAAAEHWFEALLHRLVNESALTEPDTPPENEEKALRDWIGTTGLPRGEGIEIELQAKVNPADGYLDPLHVSREMQLATRRICQVIVEGERRGTGFLVGPQTVLTNWHVVQELVPPDQTSLARLGDRLVVKFDRYRDRGAGFDGRGRAYAGRSIDMASSAYPEEYDENHISGGVAAPWAGEEERLDFALIRLDGLPGLERGWYRLRPDLEPAPGASVYVAQYPGPMALKVASGHYERLDGDPLRRRIRHRANAESGSSGGLCLGVHRFESSLQPTALHQGSVRIPPDDGGAVAVLNQAIPLARIAPLVAGHVQRVDEVVPILRLGAASGPGHLGAPVFGRELFQRYVAEAATERARILIVRPAVPAGQPATGLGKTFSAVLLRSLLAPEEHVVVSFAAGAVPVEAGALARAIIERIDPDAAEGADWTDPRDALTTEAAWLPRLLSEEFGPRLAKAARGRLVWLVIDELDQADLPDAGGRRFLHAVYQGIASLRLLRVVLIGLDGTLASIDPSVVRVEHLERPPGQPELDAWLRRRLGTERAVDPEIMSCLVRLAMDLAPTAAELAATVRDLFDPALPAQRDVEPPEGV